MELAYVSYISPFENHKIKNIQSPRAFLFYLYWRSAMERIAIYLRKSRADEDAERRGEGETLSKHKKALLKHAKDHNLNITKIYQEIVSGESLFHRPEMLKLLEEVENKEFDAVLCMDLDRLGRGNMQEQGVILETFKKANVKIITPRKVYDLRNEFDEEYSEFEAFMARKELKIINRRLQSGRVRSIEDGNYIATYPPFGYEICYCDNNRYRTLTPHPDQSEVVKLIYDLYVNQRMGATNISKKLNALGYSSATGKQWSNSTVLNVLKNKIYAGYIVWKKKEIKKSKKPGQIKESRQRNPSEWIEVKGKHESIISLELFEKAQHILGTRVNSPKRNKLSNPLAGVIRCGKCGASMVLRPYQKNNDDFITCYTNCGNKSSKFKYVESKLLESMKEWVENYKLNINKLEQEHKIDSNVETHMKVLAALENEAAELEKQKGNLHDLLERGIYDVDTYLVRSQNLADRIEQNRISTEETRKIIEREIEKNHAKKNVIPLIQNVLELYSKTEDIEQKNLLIKSIIDRAEYFKEKNQKNDDFTLIVYPRIPQ